MTALFIMDRGGCTAGIRGTMIQETDDHLLVDVNQVEYGEIAGDWQFGDEVFLPKNLITNLQDLKLN